MSRPRRRCDGSAAIRSRRPGPTFPLPVSASPRAGGPNRLPGAGGTAADRGPRPAARGYPGFVEESEPLPLGQADNGELPCESALTFATLADVLGWMDSPERRSLLNPAERGGYRYAGAGDWDGHARHQWLSAAAA